MTEDDQQRWLRGIQAAEAEELGSLEADADPQRDRRIAAAVANQLRLRKAPSSFTRTRRVIHVAASLAACFCVWLIVRGLGSQQAPLAALRLHLRGDASVMSAAVPITSVRLAGDSTLHIDIQPEQDIAGELAVNAYLYLLPTEKLIPLPIDLQRSPQGRLQGKKRVRDFPIVPTGELEAVFVVARPGRLPSEADVLRSLVTGGPPRKRAWQLLTERINLQR